eukprot:Nk52_evm6s252 gene=Nk52_evmTU6s252
MSDSSQAKKGVNEGGGGRGGAVELFVEKQLKLMEMERECEVEERTALLQKYTTNQLVKKGYCLNKLEIAGLRTGVGGKTMIDLEMNRALCESDKLPAHKFRVGDIVAFGVGHHHMQQKDQGASGSGDGEKQTEKMEGVVARVKETRITLQCESPPSDHLLDETVKLYHVGSDVTNERIDSALKELLHQYTQKGPNYDLILVLFGLAPPVYDDSVNVEVNIKDPLMRSLQMPLPNSASQEKKKGGKERKRGKSKQSDPGKSTNSGNLDGLKTLKKYSDLDSWINQSLNEPQKDAIRFCLSSHHISIIHGPPGTGKTTTVVELILQFLRLSNFKVRILACAPSNVAVDNMLERVAKFGKKLNLLRIGHPARLLPSVLNHSLDYLVSCSEGSDIVNDVRREMDEIQAKLKKPVKGKGEVKSAIYKERRELKKTFKDLRKDLRVKEREVLENLVGKAHVVFCTNTGAASHMLRKYDRQGEKFDLVVIDEAPQSLESSCWIPILKGRRLVISGDNKQLSATIISDKAASNGLSVSLFDRLTNIYSKPKCQIVTNLPEDKVFKNESRITRMLTIQYRMNENIMKWSSDAMYSGRLMCGENVESRLLSDIKGVKETDETRVPIFFIDTCGCDMYECEGDDDESKSNEGEAQICLGHVTRLIDAGVKEEDIGVITPYNGQVQILKSLFEDLPEIEIGSVDGFQGREKEAVIISLVRSNDNRDVGFLRDSKRLNVAVTRAKCHVCLICDSDTVGTGANKFLKDLLHYFSTNGEIRSGEEYV